MMRPNFPITEPISSSVPSLSARSAAARGLETRSYYPMGGHALPSAADAGTSTYGRAPCPGVDGGLSTPAQPMLQLPAVEPFRITAEDGTTRPVAATLRIGRAADNDWVLDDALVSRHHVSISPEAGGVRLRDRGSRNGTFVRGARVHDALLPAGARFTVGSTEFHVRRDVATDGAHDLIGPSPAMARIRQQIQRFGPTVLPVLILGESGTGKELVARGLHDSSGRRGPLVAVNCGALPRDLIESELFGHERGAFTGAQRRHLGCFGEANGGTLFLDEIGELPIELQPRLLRALESRSIRPVGATREQPVDVRIVAATHRDLEQAVQQGRFRADLFYRLCGLEIDLPPLRQRPEDIPALVRHFLAGERGEGSTCTMADAELARLQQYTWPGNVRQLRAALLRAAHLGGPALRADDVLPHRHVRGQTPNAALSSDETPSVSAAAAQAPSFAQIERDVYLRALTQAGGSCRAAAEILKVPKSTLHERMRRLGIRTGRVAAGLQT